MIANLFSGFLSSVAANKVTPAGQGSSAPSVPVSFTREQYNTARRRAMIDQVSVPFRDGNPSYQNIIAWNHGGTVAHPEDMSEGANYKEGNRLVFTRADGTRLVTDKPWNKR